MHKPVAAAIIGAAVSLVAGVADAAETAPHNVVLFVPDGLRALMVDAATAPTMAAVRDKGVNFTNSHSLFPTFTTANASAMATGHYLGDTGDFSNTIYAGFPVPAAQGAATPFLENDAVLGEMNAHFNSNYLDEATILAAARAKGLSTAAIGKLGPTLIFDSTDRSGAPTIIFDDATGTPAGIPLAPEVQQALNSAGLPLAAPSRGDNGKSGDAKTPGTTIANVVQQNYFADVAAKALLPLFAARKRPFVLVFWSRDPDGSQHNQGDSLNQLTPGINGPTSLAAIRNADDDLARIERALADLGLTATTDIIVSADHGFSTIAKESHTSPAAQQNYADTPPGFLPVGFLAHDLAAALGLAVHDPNDKDSAIEDQRHTRAGNALIGADPAHPEIVVAANGGSDLVYLPKRDSALVGRIIAALLKQDYVSGLFVDDALGRFPGTLPESAIAFRGKAATPQPSIIVNFRSFATGCAEPVKCTAEIADTGLQQGQGMHGSFSRADTMNFMAAIGPDFKPGFADPAPVSNADVGMTIAQLLRLHIPRKGPLVGRAIAEAEPGGKTPRFTAGSLASAPAEGLVTVLDYQAVGLTRYFDAAGFAGRTVGLRVPAISSKAAAK